MAARTLAFTVVIDTLPLLTGARRTAQLEQARGTPETGVVSDLGFVVSPRELRLEVEHVELQELADAGEDEADCHGGHCHGGEPEDDQSLLGRIHNKFAEMRGEVMGLQVDTLSHEAGNGQMEAPTRRCAVHLQDASPRRTYPRHRSRHHYKTPGRTPMSPLMMRFFTLVGIALMAASMQARVRADTLTTPDTVQVRSADWRST